MPVVSSKNERTFSLSACYQNCTPHRHKTKWLPRKFILDSRKLSFGIHLSCGFFECAILDSILYRDNKMQEQERVSEWARKETKKKQTSKKKIKLKYREQTKERRKKNLRRKRSGSSISRRELTVNEEWNGRPKMRIPKAKIGQPLVELDMRLHRSSDSCIQCRLRFNNEQWSRPSRIISYKYMYYIYIYISHWTTAASFYFVLVNCTFIGFVLFVFRSSVCH